MLTLAPVAPLRCLSLLLEGGTDNLGPHSFPTRRSSDLLFVSAESGTVKWSWVALSKVKARTLEPSFKTLAPRSEEHTSVLQSPDHVVCRLLLERMRRGLKLAALCAEASPVVTWI